MSTDNIDTLPAGVARLRAAREALAALQAEQAASVAAAPLRLPEPGETIHCLETGLTIATGQGWLAGGAVLNRGQNIVVTTALLEANRDRGGRYRGPGLAHSPEAQLAVHGRLLFAPGPAPDDMVPEHGTAEWRMAREAARQAAWAEADPERRAAALAAVNAKFGAAPVTSTIINSTPDPSIAAAAAQQKALDEGGVRVSQHVEAREAGVIGERR